MCLARPMKIVSLNGDRAEVMAAQHRHQVDISLLNHLKVGDWILAHGNLAIQQVDKKTAQEMLMLQCDCSANQPTSLK